MKIIDLLNKIANAEEIPNKFEYDNLTFKRKNNYYVDEDGDSLQKSILIDLTNLNDEIEIVEEDKEIEKLILDDLIDTNEAIYDNFHNIELKINELIDKVNSLEKRQ